MAVDEDIRNRKDPFFGDDELVCVIPFREEFGLVDGAAKLSPELTEWLTEQAPGTQWTVRMSGKGMNLVFKFQTAAAMVHFKLRWWE